MRRSTKYSSILEDAADFYENHPVNREYFALKEFLGAKGYSVSHMCDVGLLEYGDDVPVPFDRFANHTVFVVRHPKNGVELYGLKINA